MSKNNEITGDRIVNNKGSQDKYRKGWEDIFGKKGAYDDAVEDANQKFDAEIYKFLTGHGDE